MPFKNYIHLHFDEKWIHNDYIKKYVNIEPKKDELLSLIDSILLKGKKSHHYDRKKTSLLLSEVKNNVNNQKVKIFENQTH